MKPVEFVEGLRTCVIESNLEIYKNLFKDTNINQVEDTYWTNSLKLYEKYSDEEHAVFFSIIRQTQVDVVSKILGILDGSSTFITSSINFELFIQESHEKINGHLQDIFLELEE